VAATPTPTPSLNQVLDAMRTKPKPITAEEYAEFKERTREFLELMHSGQADEAFGIKGSEKEVQRLQTFLSLSRSESGIALVLDYMRKRAA
jgi:hypothetical protein